MTDLERVAIALHNCQDPVAYHWSEKDDMYKNHMRGLAIAAIEALMEPSEEAAKAGVFQIKWALATDPNNDFEIGLATDCFQAMLRAVLEGK